MLIEQKLKIDMFCKQNVINMNLKQNEKDTMKMKNTLENKLI